MRVYCRTNSIINDLIAELVARVVPEQLMVLLGGSGLGGGEDDSMALVAHLHARVLLARLGGDEREVGA